MTPGLAMFYGGMVRRKNVLGTIMHSFIAIALVSLQWILFGYSLSFGPDVKGLIGRLQLGRVGRRRPDTERGLCAHHPPSPCSWLYQMMFAVITPALISGAVAERMKFSTFLFLLLPGPRSCTIPWPTGSGGRADGSRTSGYSISPAASWCMRPPVFRRWRPRST